MKLVLGSRADGDITEIAEYITQRWGFAQTEEYVGGLGDFLGYLAKTGAAGAISRALPDTARRAKYRSHFVFFRKVDDCLVVLRVLHERMDHVRHLSGG